MIQLAPTRPPRHLDDDWLYADPLAMGPDGSDEAHDQPSESARPAGCRRVLRPRHLIGASTAGALVGLVLTISLALPQALDISRASTPVLCPEQGDITARSRTGSGSKG